MDNELKVVIVGGVAREHEAFPEGVDARRFACRKEGGNGSIRRALDAIRSGEIDAVLLLIRWMGHSTYGVLKRAARAAGIPCLVVTGGITSANRALTRFVGA